ncbi:hypothetical protein NOF04DRAFT_11903 [Fusarium oxysporum II5]|uniref:Uncharacterized protein n=2 Tax=Fusarium oxysporum species complex TaxID=171631 RepID=X0K1Z5_FUSO5|nr:uncharacterized protein FOIG_02484 [Fusarium odoratissimum NRRL 54006]EXM07473.1 hypothetical protein FOIG_02484 [Fusarium odoratissimum NRRL 54006]KAK2130751.1 hypothetical protein NOF04DRAFT_11903 [Fusarium oxysporum II5]TXC10258.1 hypothetical protein FocTR4_00004593 [Fusarium oxysporum f. sp. cubense]
MAQITENDALPPIEDTDIIWPDDLPNAPQFQEEDEPATTPMDQEIEPDDRDWTEILAEQDRRLFEIRVNNAKLYSGYLYSHIPNSIIDWELDGSTRPCRVQGLSYYSKPMGSIRELENHLKSAKHLKYDASLARQSPAPKQTTDQQDYQVPVPPLKRTKLEHTVSPEELMSDDLVLEDKPFNEALQLPSSFNYPPWLVIPDSQDTASEDEEMTLSPTTEPRLKHTIEKTTGDDLVLKDKSFDEASEYPSSFNYPPWLVIPDSRETSEDEEMLPSPANELGPVLKHTVEKTTGENLVLEDKSFEEASKMPLSFSYPPWGVVQDSDEDSENEPYVHAV